MVSQIARYMSLTATVDHCAFALQRIDGLHAAGDAYGANWPWFEMLVRPDPACFHGSPGAFVDCLYRHRPSAATDIEVLDRAARWLGNQPHPTRISVNTHPHSLTAGYFVEAVSRYQYALAGQGHSLCLELIEFGECSDRRTLIDNAQLLRRRGVLIALDDFGSRLNCFDLCAAGIVDVVKIDSTLVSQLERRQSQRAIIEGVTTLARGLGGTVVAEGIERDEELRALTDLGVGYAQGYFIHRPEVMEI
jgi:EAL domain-containing protein (putative c-di-GMP-specific phosphodiesterase class I)